MMKRSEWPKLTKLSAILLLVPTLFASVASVPTSVLVQNSELNANNDIEGLNELKLNHNNNKNNNNLLNKVKRSSGLLKNQAHDYSTTTVSASPANNGLEKKSSPEVVPALYNSPPSQSPQRTQAMEAVAFALPSNADLLNTAIAAGLTAAAVEAAAASNQRDLDQSQLYEDDYRPYAEEPQPLLHKRGISAAQQRQYSYGSDANDGYYSNPYLSQPSIPIGVWGDELDPPVAYTDLQELDDYAPLQRLPSYRNKAYDNLQNLLNAEAYLEPLALPYASRYYGTIDGNRRKRSSPNKYNRYAEIRAKREAKLTPADMLALVALVEAGERARKDSESEVAANVYAPDTYGPRNYYGNNNLGLYDYPATAYDEDNNDELNFNDGVANLNEPAAVDYYGLPIKKENLDTNENFAPRSHKYGGRNRYAVERLILAKKNRAKRETTLCANNS